MMTTMQKGNRKKRVPQTSTKALCCSFSNLLRYIKSTLTCLSSRKVIAPPSRNIAEKKCHSSSCSPTDPELNTYRMPTSIKVMETKAISNPLVRVSVLIMILSIIVLVNSGILKKNPAVRAEEVLFPDLKVFMGQIFSSLLILSSL